MPPKGSASGDRVNPSDDAKIRLFLEIGRREKKDLLFSSWQNPNDKAKWTTAWENLLEFAKR